MGSLDGCQRIFRILSKAVEEMFGIVKDLSAVLFKEPDGIADHGKIFLHANAKNLGDMQRPGLTNDRNHRRPGGQEHLDLRILLYLHATATRHSKGGDLRVLPLALRRLLKKGSILWIRAGPAAFNIVDSEDIQLLGNTNLVEHRERNSGALRPVTQSRVVQSDWLYAHEKRPPR